MDTASPQHVATVATEIFIQIAIYSHLQEQSLSLVSPRVHVRSQSFWREIESREVQDKTLQFFPSPPNKG